MERTEFERKLKKGIVVFDYLTQQRKKTATGEKKYKIITMCGTTTPIHKYFRHKQNPDSVSISVYDMVNEKWMSVRKTNVLEVKDYLPWFEEDGTVNNSVDNFLKKIVTRIKKFRIFAS